ncbi:hypothetical protein HDU87_004725 [Geranomyces variabilis]|uniref:DUF962 domain-containing protein n=1 Tax=Geranomyces variabilis TaxID=109894 RepID=A0AAD5TND1_9FUNG|nr:hypothetical protein HDU87_004725 [Geranomyces variabilis]
MGLSATDSSDRQAVTRHALLARTSADFVRSNSHTHGSLLDEMAFVSWFHAHPHNRLVHVGSVALAVALFSSAVAPLPVLRGVLPFAPQSSALVFAIPAAYTAYFATLVRSSLIPSAIYLGISGTAGAMLHAAFASSMNVPRIGWSATIALIGMVTLILQGVGHRVFEGRQPAFRPFEAAVTAPFSTVLWVCAWLGLPWAKSIVAEADHTAADPAWVARFVMKQE